MRSFVYARVVVLGALALGVSTEQACSSASSADDQPQATPSSPAASPSASPSAPTAVSTGAPSARPATVREAVRYLIGQMSAEDQAKVRQTKREDLILFHHGWGTAIRNQLGLWGDNAALLADTHKQHPDDASMVIIEAVWAELQKNQ